MGRTGDPLLPSPVGWLLEVFLFLPLFPSMPFQVRRVWLSVPMWLSRLTFWALPLIPPLSPLVAVRTAGPAVDTV